MKKNKAFTLIAMTTSSSISVNPRVAERRSEMSYTALRIDSRINRISKD